MCSNVIGTASGDVPIMSLKDVRCQSECHSKASTKPLLSFSCSSINTIQPAAKHLCHLPPFDIPTIHIEDVDASDGSEYQEGKEGQYGVNGQESCSIMSRRIHHQSWMMKNT